MGRIFRWLAGEVTLADRLKLSFWLCGAIRYPKLIDFTIQRLDRFIRRSVLCFPKEIANDLPELVASVLDLFRADVRDRFDERAGSSGSFGREFALSALQFSMEEMVALGRLSGKPVSGDLHCFLIEHDADRALRRGRVQSAEAARLESEFAKAPRALAGDARQVMTRLIDEAEVDARLEAASNRLEAFEDLYEGANDRIADYRWYLSSEWLEVGIIFLLVIEVAMLGFQIHHHLK